MKMKSEIIKDIEYANREMDKVSIVSIRENKNTFRVQIKLDSNGVNEKEYRTLIKKESFENFTFNLMSTDSRIKKIEERQKEWDLEFPEFAGSYNCETTSYVTENQTMDVYMVNRVVVEKFLYEMFTENSKNNDSHCFIYADSLYDVVLAHSI